MIKKIVKIGILGGAVLCLLPLIGLSSYTDTIFQKVKGAFKNQVPLEFELERVRNEVSQLIPDMKKNLSVIAEEMVAVQNLKDDIATVQGNLGRQKERILAMTKELDGKTQAVVYFEGRDFTRNRLSQKLARDLAAYKRCDKELGAKEQLLEAKERSLETAREQLASMREQRRELEVQVAQLEADLKTVRLQQTKSKFQLDDSRLATIKGTLSDIRNRMRVETTTAELYGEFANEVPAEIKAKPVGEITKEVKEYFGATKNGKLVTKD